MSKIASRQGMPDEIHSFCERFSKGISGLNSFKACIEYGREELPDLLLNKRLYLELMGNIVRGGPYPDIRRPTLFDNELVLYIHPERLFSLRVYLWGPGDCTYPHDHNSWGVIGTVTDGYEVTNYRRVDDGSREGYAKLEEVERRFLGPGQTAFTLPFEEGIHKTGNSGSQTIVTLHLYGESLPRGYLQGFDTVNDRVYRILPPRLKKEELAAQALAGLEEMTV